MAIDREASLKKAEKFLRQGRLDGAIEEYVRLLEEQPKDWNTRNALGDLHVRAGQIEKAAAQFTAIADHFNEEGFHSKAIALYKKVVKIKPNDEHALLQAADINARQGLLADAKHCLADVAEQRRRRGDKAGCAEALIRIADLDPADLAARMSAARSAAETGDSTAAAARYKDLAAELFTRNRPDEGVDALAEAVHLDPSDVAARDSLVAAYLNRGDIDEARRYAYTPGHFKALADTLTAAGRENDAVEALFEAVQHDPSDFATRSVLVGMLLSRGDMERAKACLQPELLGDDPQLLLLAADLDLRTGQADTARALLRTLVERDAGRREDVLRLGCRLAATDADAGFGCVEIACDAAITASDWAGAASALREFSRVVPSHIPALIKLVDVCVDGDLDEPLATAQAELAECYLTAGRAFEARVIAEDLLTRAPKDTANVDRLRRALVMLGEKDPDAIIAERLNPESAIGFDDLNNLDLPAKPAFEVEAPPAKVIPFSRNVESADADRPETAPAGRATTAVPPATSTSPLAAPVEQADAAPVSQRAEVAARPAREGSETGEWEIDLSEVLGDMKPSAAPPQPAAARAADASEAASTRAGSGTEPTPQSGGETGLETVFQDFREEVLREQASTKAAQQYKLALTYHDMGMDDECIKALEVSARSPKYRFQSASLLARIHRHHGRTQDAIDWFERAAETPATSADAGRALLYELGQTLEGAGESVRALAVYLELQADAGDYQDVAARIKQLSR